MRHSKQCSIATTRGQALPEYIVGTLVTVIALFTPIPAFNDKSVLEALRDAFQKNYQGFEYTMSQPVKE